MLYYLYKIQKHTKLTFHSGIHTYIVKLHQEARERQTQNSIIIT